MEKFAAFLMALALPFRLLERGWVARKSGLDDLCDGYFFQRQHGRSERSDAEHYNIVSNTEQMEQVFSLERQGPVPWRPAVLPFVWFHRNADRLPAVLGVGVVYRVNPLDARTIGSLVCDYKVTFLLATPTFLQLYMRGCAPEQFGSLRVVAGGAEKLPHRLASAFEEQFGIRPFEAYGCTECAPAVAVNTPDFARRVFIKSGSSAGGLGIRCREFA